MNPWQLPLDLLILAGWLGLLLAVAYSVFWLISGLIQRTNDIHMWDLPKDYERNRKTSNHSPNQHSSSS